MMDNGFRCGQSVIKWIPWDKVRIHKKSHSALNQHVENDARRKGLRPLKGGKTIKKLGSQRAEIESPIGVILSSRLVSLKPMVRDSSVLERDSPGVNFNPYTLSHRSNPSRYFFSVNKITKKPLLVASGISKNLLLPLSKAPQLINLHSVVKPLTKDAVISTEGD